MVNSDSDSQSKRKQAVLEFLFSGLLPLSPTKLRAIGHIFNSSSECDFVFAFSHGSGYTISTTLSVTAVEAEKRLRNRTRCRRVCIGTA